jgi:hypothetical protein
MVIINITPSAGYMVRVEDVRAVFSVRYSLRSKMQMNNGYVLCEVRAEAEEIFEQCAYMV